MGYNGNGYEVGNEDEGGTRTRGDIPGQELIGVDRSCVRTGSDTPTGSILITFVICPQFAQSNTHRVHVEYFQKVPTTEPAEGGLDLPTGSILINFTLHPPRYPLGTC